MAYDKFVALADQTAVTVAGHPKQQTSDVVRLYADAAKAQPLYRAFLDEIKRLAAPDKCITARLKSISRVMEKAMFCEDAEKRGRVDGVCDVVRGLVQSVSMTCLLEVLRFICVSKLPKMMFPIPYC